MVTTVGHEKDLPSLLHGLVTLEHNAIEAYDAAIERLDDQTASKRLAEFRADHERHITELSPHLQGMGDTVPDSPGKKQILTVGKIKFASLVGDSAILTAMVTNEIETESAYRTASERDDVDGVLADKLNAAQKDEARHMQWMKERASHEHTF